MLKDIFANTETAILILLPTLLGLYYISRILELFVQALMVKDPYEFQEKNFLGGMMTNSICAIPGLIPFYYFGLNDEVLIIVFGMILFLSVMGWWQVSRRHQRRTCAVCGRKMRKIEEAIDERRFSDVQQAWVDYLQSKDLEVWVCSEGHIRKDAYPRR